MGKGEYLGEFELVVLIAVARLGQAAYGMTVYEEIQATTGRDVSVPAVYVTLTRLERKGYVSSHKSDPDADRGGRPKKFYRLERAGVAALEQSRTMLDRLWKGVQLKPRATS
jgi:PadR family transcriptional regulator PadR